MIPLQFYITYFCLLRKKIINFLYFPKEKDERNKTEEVSECNLFDSFSFEAKDAKTAILLLQSKEKSVLLTTVKALSQYANKSKDNIKILFDLDIVKNILPIIEHEDIFTRRLVLYRIYIYRNLFISKY